ncbi:MAG: hypothetical protein V4707_07065 [Pseudomonadota bacterium]
MFFAALLSLALSGPAETDPLAPAREGMAQCYTPNKAARTCRALANYEFHADGTITNYAVVLVNPTPLIVMRAETMVHISHGAVCGTSSDSDIRGFVIDGQTLAGPLDQQLRDASAAMRAAGPQGETCTTYIAGPDGALAYSVSVGGQSQPDTGDTVLWVNPNEGWKVAP